MSLAVEIGFQPVSYCLMQEDPWPSRTQYDFHRSRRCINRFKLDDRLASCLFTEIVRCQIMVEEFYADTSSTPCLANLKITVIIGYAGDREARKRLDIAHQPAVR